MNPTVIFGAMNIATSIAGYMGLIESVGGNIQKLLHQSFKSAIQNLEYATTTPRKKQLEYIRVAKDRFF